MQKPQAELLLGILWGLRHSSQVVQGCSAKADSDQISMTRGEALKRKSQRGIVAFLQGTEQAIKLSHTACWAAVCGKHGVGIMASLVALGIKHGV
jgi:hypothetical protein